MNFAQSLRSLLKRHRWGLLGLILISLSLYWLHALTFVHPDPPDVLSQLHMAARTSSWGTTPTEILFSPAKDALDINFNVPVNGDETIEVIVSNPVNVAAPCQQFADSTVSHGRGKDGLEWAQTTFRVSAVNSRVLITCHVRIVPTSETFEDRKILIKDFDDSNGSNLFHNTDLTLHFDGFKVGGEGADIEFKGAPQDVEASYYQVYRLRYGSEITGKWKDKQRSQSRDVRLVLVGALFGFAFACALEWIRPWVEARKEQNQPPNAMPS
jgi:hypothetical protein